MSSDENFASGICECVCESVCERAEVVVTLLYSGGTNLITVGASRLKSFFIINDVDGCADGCARQ